MKITSRSTGNCESILNPGFAPFEITPRIFSYALVDGRFYHMVVVSEFPLIFSKKARSCNRLVYNSDKADDSIVLDELYLFLVQL